MSNIGGKSIRPSPSIKRNYGYSAIGAAVPIIVSLVVVPLYIRHVGTERYGVMAIVWLILGYFGFFDFGLSRASANALSKLTHEGPSKRAPVIVTVFYLNSLLGLFGGLALYGVGHFMAQHMASLSVRVHIELVRSLPWIAAMLPLNLLSSVGTGVIESRERFAISNLLNGLGGILTQVVPICCAIIINPSLETIVPAAFVARAVSASAILAYVLWTERPIDPRVLDQKQIRSLVGYGAWVSVSGLISPLLETFDQMLVGTLLGPAALAHYAVPMSMTTRLQIIATALAKTLFPRLSRIGSREADQLALKATTTLAFGFAAVCGPAIVLAGPFLNLWLGTQFARLSTSVAVILLVGCWTNAVGFIPFTLLQSQGRPDLSAKIHMAEIVPFLLSVWSLSRRFGLPGAALAWTLRVTVDLSIMLAAARMLQAGLSAIIAPAALVTLAVGIALLAQPTGLSALAWAFCLGVAAIAAALILDETTRDLGRGLVRR